MTARATREEGVKATITPSGIRSTHGSITAFLAFRTATFLRLPENRRKDRLLGAELDAALEDPRWAAGQSGL